MRILDFNCLFYGLVVELLGFLHVDVSGSLNYLENFVLIVSDFACLNFVVD